MISGLYIQLLIWEFGLRKRVLGIENALLRLKSIDKRAIIPILRKEGAIIGNGCDFESGLTFHNCTNLENLKTGDGVHIGKNCVFDLRDKVTIGNCVTISMGSSIITHLDCGKSSLTRKYPFSHACITIEDNVYLGCGVTVLQGVTVRRNSFVAANSLVTETCDSNSLIGGVPAKKIRVLEP